MKYYFKMPADIEERDVIVVDPMLATGGSASAAITFLKQDGVKHIKLMCIIGAPEGVKRMQEDHPDVDIFVAALDDHLNDHGYIVPGLGDAGDRIFGTASKTIYSITALTHCKSARFFYAAHFSSFS